MVLDLLFLTWKNVAFIFSCVLVLIVIVQWWKNSWKPSSRPSKCCDESKKGDRTVHEGNLCGSLFKILLPRKKRNLCGKVLIFCHGYRPVGIKLEASMDPQRRSLIYKDLLHKGWIVASLSYRREGYILEDAITDVNNLRTHIISEFLSEMDSTSLRFILDSESMGGAICTLISERHFDLYDGIFATGAALWIDRTGKESIDFLHTPHVPILYLMNSSELSWIRSYQKRVEEAYRTNVALWHVDKGGHCDFTDKEIGTAFSAFLEWIFCSSSSSPEICKFKNVTEISSFLEENIESKVKMVKGGGGSVGKVVEIEDTGSVHINFSERDLLNLDIRRGNTFYLSVGKTKRRKKFVLGEYPFVGVKDGELVAVTGKYSTELRRRAVQTTNDDIAKVLGVGMGTKVVVHRRVVEIRKEKSQFIRNRMKAFE